MAYTPDQISRLKRIGNRFYAYTTLFGVPMKILHSSDGAAWTEVTQDEVPVNHSIHWCRDMAGDDESQLLVLQHYESNNSMLLYYSTDNVNFEFMGEHPFPPDYMRMHKIDGIFYMLLADHSIYSTTNGAVLQVEPFYDSLTMGETSVIGWDAAENMFRRLDNMKGSYTSFNGVNWSSGEVPNVELGRITYLNGRFVVNFFDTNDLQDYTALSTDGVVFDQVTQTGFCLEYSYCNGKYLAIGPYNAGNTFLESSDGGVTWNSYVAPGFIFNSSTGFIQMNNGVYLVTYNGSLYSSTNLVNWTLVTTGASGYKATDGTTAVVLIDNVIHYSTNGTDWTPSDTSDDYGFQDVFSPSPGVFVWVSNQGITVSENGGVNYVTNLFPVASELNGYSLYIDSFRGAMSSPAHIAMMMFVNNVRHFLYTTDYGQSWNLTPSDLNMPPMERRTYQYDSSNGLYNTDDTHTGYFYLTNGDASSWTAMQNPMSNQGVSYNSDSWRMLRVNGYLIIANVTNQGMTIFRTPDGMDAWEQLSVSGVDITFSSIQDRFFEFNGNVYIVKFSAYSDDANREIDYIYTSTDLEEWSERYIASQNDSETWSEGSAVGGSPPFTPGNGMRWANDILFSKDKFKPVGGNTANYTSWNYYPAEFDNGNGENSETFYSIAFSAEHSATILQESTDCENFYPLVIGLENFQTGPFVSETEIAVMAYDGVNITMRWYDFSGNQIGQSVVKPEDPNEYWTSVFYGNGKWYFVYINIDNDNTVVLSTTDRSTWVTDVTLPTQGYGNYMPRPYKKTVLYGGPDGTYYLSDGVTWDVYNPPAGELMAQMDYCEGLDLYLMMTYDENTYEIFVYTAPDGITWTRQSLPDGNIGFYSDVYAFATGDRFILRAANGDEVPLMFYTYDFVDYTGIPVPPSEGGSGPPGSGLIIGSEEHNLERTITYLAVERSTYNTTLLSGVGEGGEG